MQPPLRFPNLLLDKNAGFPNLSLDKLDHLFEENKSYVRRQWIICLKRMHQLLEENESAGSKYSGFGFVDMSKICFQTSSFTICWILFGHVRANIKTRAAIAGNKIKGFNAQLRHLGTQKFMKIEIVRRLENQFHHPRAQNCSEYTYGSVAINGLISCH